MSFFSYLGRRAGKSAAKQEWHSLVTTAAKTESNELRSAARTAATTEARAALETEARAAVHESAEVALKSAQAGAAPARIDAYFRGASKVIGVTGGVGLGGLGVWRMEQTARDAGDKAFQMGRDVAESVHDDVDAAVQAVAHIPQRLTEGLNVSGPVKTLIQTGTVAVMIGGAVFTVYGTYRLFR